MTCKYCKATKEKMELLNQTKWIKLRGEGEWS